MASTTLFDKAATFLRQEVRESLIDLCGEAGYASGVLITRTRRYWSELLPTGQTPEQPAFDLQLSELLRTQLQNSEDIAFPQSTLDALAAELFEFLTCSLASNRTANEIIDGLRDDTDMRSEVVALVLSATGISSYHEEQRAFLERTLSGDDGLRKLLNTQAQKQRFPRLL